MAQHQRAHRDNTAIFVAAAGETDPATATFTKLGHMTSFSTGEDSTEDLNVDDFTSDPNAEDTIAGRTTTSEVTFELNIDFEDTSQALLRTLATTKEERLFKIEDTYVDNLNATQVAGVSFQGYIKNYNGWDRQVNEIKTASVTFKRTTSVVDIP